MKKYNLFLILLISLFLLIIGLNCKAATLTLTPATGTYNVNNTFSIDIYVNTSSQNVDTVAAYVNYNSANFQVTGIDTTGSLFTMQAENDFSTLGKIKITRGIPAPGVVNNPNGFVAKVNFKALSGISPTSDNITFDFTAGDANKSNVFLAGNPLLASVSNARYTVTGTGDTQSPTVPSNLVASAVSSSQINLTWTASTDNVGVTGYRIYRGGVQIGTSATNSYSNTGLSASTAYSYTVAAYDAAGNLSGQSSSASATTQTTSDTQAPTVTAFTIPTTAVSLSVSVSSFTAADNVGVTGYMITESATAPSASASGWSATAPTIYTFSSSGSKTLYAWAKDAAGNVSASKTATVTITVSLTLSVTLTANPSSGTAPLNGVDLSASVSGTATGNINYTFYCNRSDTGTNITTPNQGKYDNISIASYNAADICNYSNAGSYTAKVIAEQGGYQAEARVGITVNTATPVPTPTGNSLPVGNVDGADSTHVSGWAYDADAGTSPITVHIYVDGIMNGSVTANLSRPDIVGALSGAVKDGNHGFDYSFLNLTSGTHTVRVYAINTPQGTNPELAGSPKTIGTGTTPTPTPNPLPPCCDNDTSLPYPNGSILTAPGSDKIYFIVNNQKSWLTSPSVFLSYGLPSGGQQTVSQADLDKYSTGPDINQPAFAAGALIRAKGDFKVWIIKPPFKRHIFNPAIFNMYSHFNWASIKDVDLSVVDSYITSDVYRADGDTRVYSLEEVNEAAGTAIKHHINMSPAEFTAKGYSWNQIFIVNARERDYYQTGGDYTP